MRDTQGHLPGLHRRAGHLPLRAGDRLRHPHGRRRHARQGRHHPSRPAGVRHRRRGRRRRPAPTPRVIYVPPPFAADAILEAVDAGMRARRLHHRGHPGARHGAGEARALAAARTRLIGPNCPGVITPGECKIGIMPGHIHKRGQDRHRLALGHADLRGGGADDGGRARPVDLRRHRRRPGQRHQLRRLPRDCSWPIRETEGIVMIGEIGGTAEEEAAEFLKRSKTQEAGRRLHRRASPRRPGRRMGHAGAIISGGKGGGRRQDRGA